MKLKYYILFLFFTLSSRLCEAQIAPPWSYAQTGISMQLFFTNTSQYNIGSRLVNQGDYVGVFYQWNGNEICAGYSQLLSDSIQVLVFTDTALAHNMYLKLWNGMIGCSVDSVIITDTDWNMQFNLNSATIRGLESVVYREVIYPKTEFCINNDNVVNPQFSPHYFVAAFEDSLGLSIDSSGSFVPSENQAGIYPIIVKSHYCVVQNVLYLSIIDDDTCFSTVNKENILAPGSGNPDYQTIEFSAPGKIRIFNVQGVEVRTLTGPAEWDGTDNQGLLLPTDEYYILFETGEQKLVTILR